MGLGLLPSAAAVAAAAAAAGGRYCCYPFSSGAITDQHGMLPGAPCC